MAATGQRFPQELLDLIADYIDGSDEKITLHSYALASPACLHYSRRRILHKVYARSSPASRNAPADFSAFLSFISSSTNVCEYIDSVTFCTSRPDDGSSLMLRDRAIVTPSIVLSVLPLLPHIRDLIFREVRIDASNEDNERVTQIIPYQLRSLRFTHVGTHVDNRKPIFVLLRLFSSIDELEFSDVALRMMSPSPEENPEIDVLRFLVRSKSYHIGIDNLVEMIAPNRLTYWHFDVSTTGTTLTSLNSLFDRSAKSLREIYFECGQDISSWYPLQMNGLIALDKITVHYTILIEWPYHIFRIFSHLPPSIRTLTIIANPQKFRLRGYTLDLEREFDMVQALRSLRKLESVVVDLSPGGDAVQSTIASEVLRRNLPTLDGRGLLQMISETVTAP